MDSTSKINLGLEIWRSQLNPSTKVEKYLIIGIILFVLVFPIFIFLLLLPILTLIESVIFFLMLEGILSLILSPLIIFSIHYFLSYIIIFEKGVIVREKSFLKLWKKRYIIFEEIKDIDIGGTVTWKADGSKVYIKKIVIRVKGKNSYQISSNWVNDVNYVKELLTYYKDKISS